jgi:broad specificity phosphatase PhoE
MKITNSRFLFVRHANTDSNPVDTDRTLTEKGHEQIIALRQKLSGVDFDLAIASSAKRTQQAARLILGEDTRNIVVLEALYRLPDDEGQRLLTAMSDELGYANLRAYLEHRDAETLHRLGRNGSRAIAEAIGEPASGMTVLVVSHAVLLNAVIYYLFSSEEVRNLALEANLGECGAIEVVVGETENDISARIIN